jgi:hypothetical protein
VLNAVPATPLLPAAGEAGRFRAPRVDVRADRILRIQGYSDPAQVRERIGAAARFAAELACELAAGEVGYRRVAVTRLRDGVLELDDRHALRCAAFDQHLAGCSSVLLFVLSAGAAFDARIAALMHEDRPVEGLFLDTAGWLAVECVTRQFAARLRRGCAASGMRLTRRLAPGCSYRVGTRVVPWELAQQHELFAALGEAPLPAQLLDSAAMCPKMSRSGLFGLRATATPG